MKILVDENIPVAEACFGQLGEVVPVSGRHLRAAQVRDADALIVRSVTPVNESLLAGSRIGFVGTATIGVDHIDQAYLAAHGIGFASAPGCNARSVVEYVAAALMELEASRRFSLSGKSIGIIGVGNVGSRLRQLCEALAPTWPPRPPCYELVWTNSMRKVLASRVKLLQGSHARI